MKKNRNLYKYIYISVAFFLLFTHFFFFVRLHNCEVINTGFAFGIGNNVDIRYSLIITLSSICFLVLGIIFLKEYIPRDILIGILILSIGNSVNRILGGVCDYISFPNIVSFNLPLFNLLDLGIVLGMCLIFVGIIKNIWKK